MKNEPNTEKQELDKLRMEKLEGIMKIRADKAEEERLQAYFKKRSIIQRDRRFYEGMRKVEKDLELDNFVDYRKKLRAIIHTQMTKLDRTGIRVKTTENMNLCASYVGLIDGCNQVRAKQSVISLGINPLKSIEIHDIDSDISDEFEAIYPYTLFSDEPSVKSMVSMIENRKISNLSDFISKTLWMWGDDAGYISTFSNNYGINSPSVCYNAFYLGIGKLIENHIEYATLAQKPATTNAIEEAMSIGTQINGFRASFLKIVHL